jgi:hypothetical protein
MDHLIYRHDVRVIQGRGGLCLANEPFGAGSIRLVCDHFQGDLAIKLGVAGGIDFAHSSLADKTSDDKTA